MLKIFDTLETNRRGTKEGIPRAEGEALYSFIKNHNIKRVVETGVNWGFTSYYILAALPSDGLLFSIEPLTSLQLGAVIPVEWRNRWRLIAGISRDKLLDTFLHNPVIDLFFHDSDHHRPNQLFEYETALPFVPFIGSHDIHLYGPVFAWDTFVKDHNLKVLVTLGQLGIGQVY